MTLSASNRKHALTSLAALSKYQGRYDLYLKLKQRYSLKWSSSYNSMQSLQRFFNPDLTFDVMLSKVKEMMQVLPADMALVIRHAVMTGLRPAEAVESARLINDKETFAQYYDAEQMTLNHYKFSKQFLRTTKKAYVSYITLDNLQPIRLLDHFPPTWNAIRLACKRRGLNMEMSLTRKLFASYLRQEGIQPEVVDMLQGRVSQSVLIRHYLVPEFPKGPGTRVDGEAQAVNRAVKAK
jgi:hypothetical protein